MQLTVLSSFACPCGVAATTETLITNLAAKNVNCRVIAPRREPYVPSQFTNVVYYYNEHEALAQLDRAEGPIHIQYSNALFSKTFIDAVINLARTRGQKVIITLHDSCIATNNVFAADLVISASRRLVQIARAAGAQSEHVPFGLPNTMFPTQTEKRIVSFGLGRNRDDLIHPLVQELGWNFQTFYGHRRWTPKKQLLRELAKSAGITLYYPDTGAIVSSSALPIALASGRPVIVSKTTWFQPEDLAWQDELIDTIKNLIYFADDNNLKKVITDALSSSLSERWKILNYLKTRIGEKKVAERFYTFLTKL